MEKILQMTLLYDFYGELLTERQKSVFELYYLNDLSLNEISEEYNITRQAVRDMLKRTEKLLLRFEAKLLLVERFLSQKETVNKAVDILAGLKSTEEISKVLDMLLEIGGS